MNFNINTMNDKVTFDIIMTEEKKEEIKQKKINEGNLHYITYITNNF